MRIRRAGAVKLRQPARIAASGRSVPRSRGRLRRAVLPLAGSLALGLALSPAAVASHRGSNAGRGRLPGAFRGPGVWGALRGPLLWSPGVPAGPSLEAFERIAPSVESPRFLREDPLSASALQQNVDVYGSLPNHYTGTAYDALELGVIKRELAADGLEPGQVSYSFPENVPTRIALTVGSVREPASALAPEQYSGVTGPRGISGQLYYGGDGTGDLTAGAGKIVVFSGGNVTGAVKAGAAAGAKAIVAVSPGVQDFPAWADINARGGTGSVPVLYVGKDTGTSVVSAAEAGQNANVVLQAQEGTAIDSDVWGVLPGKDRSRRIFIATPSSSMVPAASERGSGDAAVLGLARHYAELPRSQRPVTLVFLFTTGHEVGFLGLSALIKATGNFFTGQDAFVWLGSGIGNPTTTEDPDGELTVSPLPSPSGGLHYSENPLIEGLFADFFAGGVTVPTTAAHTSTAGEQVSAYAAGVPTIGWTGSSIFFHTTADLPDTVDPTLLAEETQGFRNVIDALSTEPAGAVQAANGQAAALGAQINPDTRDPSNPVLGAAGVGGPEPQIVSVSGSEG
jgi:hypothetical protein